MKTNHKSQKSAKTQSIEILGDVAYVRILSYKVVLLSLPTQFVFFFFNDTATTEIYTLSYTTLFRSLRRADEKSALPEDLAQRARLDPVVLRRGGAVRVHVPDVRRREARLLERRAHRADHPLAFRMGRGHVEGIGAHAVARQLGVDARVARS